jgi:hypothetical protein
MQKRLVRKLLKKVNRRDVSARREDFILAPLLCGVMSWPVFRLLVQPFSAKPGKPRE